MHMNFIVALLISTLFSFGFVDGKFVDVSESTETTMEVEVEVADGLDTDRFNFYLYDLTTHFLHAEKNIELEPDYYEVDHLVFSYKKSHFKRVVLTHYAIGPPAILS